MGVILINAKDKKQSTKLLALKASETSVVVEPHSTFNSSCGVTAGNGNSERNRNKTPNWLQVLVG